MRGYANVIWKLSMSLVLFYQFQILLDRIKDRANVWLAKPDIISNPDVWVNFLTDLNPNNNNFWILISQIERLEDTSPTSWRSRGFSVILTSPVFKHS
jgi:hypothetical protein